MELLKTEVKVLNLEPDINLRTDFSVPTVLGTWNLVRFSLVKQSTLTRGLEGPRLAWGWKPRAGQTDGTTVGLYSLVYWLEQSSLSRYPCSTTVVPAHMSEYSKDAFLGGLCTHKWFANGDRTQGAGCLDAQKHLISVYMYASLVHVSLLFKIPNFQINP